MNTNNNDALSKLVAILNEYERTINSTHEYCVRRNQPFDNNKLLQTKVQRFLSAYGIATDIFGYNTNNYDWIFSTFGYAKPVSQETVQKTIPSKAIPSKRLKNVLVDREQPVHEQRNHSLHP
jgi:hypothetical protein